jgi:hypothetical protein
MRSVERTRLAAEEPLGEITRVPQVEVANLRPLAKAITALAPKLTDAQASQALDPILQQFHKTDSSSALQALAEAIQAVTVKLADAEADPALSRVLAKFREAPHELGMSLPSAIRALSARFTESQAGTALFRVLDEMSQTNYRWELAELIPTLAAKLTDAQARQALDQILTMMGGIDFGYARKELAQTFHVVAPKLAPEQARMASDRAKTALAWAESEEEATEWARALVALLDRAGDLEKTQKLVAAVAYPAAAGSATDVLLDAIRAQAPDARAKEAGTQASLEWLAKRYPKILRPPGCPAPPQPYEISGLRCPPVEAEAAPGTPAPAGGK